MVTRDYINILSSSEDKLKQNLQFSSYHRKFYLILFCEVFTEILTLIHILYKGKNIKQLFIYKYFNLDGWNGL